MNTLILATLLTVGAVQETDTLLDVGSATLLEVEAPGGSIQVTTWDRNQIRVQAEHSSRTYIEIDRGGRSIELEAEARRGPANLVDFVLTVPRGMDLELDGMYTDITVDGSDGEVEAENLQGDIVIRGGRGRVSVSTVSGEVQVEGAEGRVEVESAASDIRVRDSAGEIYGESAGGDIVLEGMRASVVDVGVVGGRVYYEGTFDPQGTYFFGSHGGSVTLVVPPDASATISVATLHGNVTSNLEGSPRRFERGERHAFDLGGGGALVEVETFAGRINLLRPDSPGARPPAP